MYWDHYWGHGVWMVGWWVIVAAGIAWVVWMATRAGRREDQGTSAEEELRRRYAAGQIDEDEYRKRLSVLRESRR